MTSSRLYRTAFLLLFLATGCATHQTSEPSKPAVRSADSADAILRSDAFAQQLLHVMGQFDPEEASSIGVVAAEGRVSDLSLEADARAVAAYRAVEKRFRAQAETERDIDVRADLLILADAAAQHADDRGPWEPSEAGDRAYITVARVLYSGVTGVLTEPVSPARARAALARLNAYAGLDGTTPLVEAAEARARVWLAQLGGTGPDKSGPARTKLQRDLASTQKLLEGLEEYCREASVPDLDRPLQVLKEQLTQYDAFITETVLPRARTEDRLSELQYRRALRARGIEADPEALALVARKAFAQTLVELKPLAEDVAGSLGIPGGDYRTVLAALRRQQVPPGEVLALYQQRLKDIDAILRTQRLVTVPSLPLTIHIASAAEGAMMAAPHYNMPSLMGEGGGGDFVLPAPEASQGPRAMDDFNSPAASWWLTAHEGHPGHGMQFAAMMARPMSLARRYFAFNSANCEGWGLYSEGLIMPYLPPEGRLGVLQARLMREAHTFLDIELNLGRITAEEAHRILTEEVVMSQGWADLCLQRYTFMMPGQAPSYFYGATELEAIRAEVQRRQGKSFNLQAFNDFVLSQGLVPPSALRKLVDAHWP